MKRIATIVICLALLVSVFPMGAISVSAASSGTTGDCKWSLSGTKLTISGKGAMGDYDVTAEEYAPWGIEITSVTIKEGVTAVGVGAFYSCVGLTTVKLPNSLTEVRELAFCGCISLESITIPENVKTIGAGAFSVCKELQSVSIPYGIETIGDMAFYMTWLTRVRIPSTVTYLGVLAFGECDKLHEAIIGNGVTYLAEGLFYNCKRMQELTFTDHVTLIKESAFEGCPELYILNYTGTKEQLDAITVEQGNEQLSDITFLNTGHIQIISATKKNWVYQGETVSIKLDVIGNNYRIEWRFNNSKGKEEISTVTGDTYAVKMTKTARDRKVWCCLYDENDNCISKSAGTVLREKGQILEQLQDAYAPMGAKMKVTIKASGSDLRYNWYYKRAGAKEFTEAFNTSSSFTPEMSELWKNCQVYCVVTDGQQKKLKSNVIVLRESVSIATQPKTGYAQLNKTAKVTVKATGDGLTYTWYVKDAGSTKYVKSSITSSTYSVKMTEKVHGRRVYCVVKDKYGKTVQSKTVLLRRAASIVTQPKSVTVKKNATAKVTVKAAGDGLKYTWYIKNAGQKKYSKSSVTKSTYSVKMTSKVNGRYVYCVVTDQYGKTVKSSTVRVKMK